jgi:hypothetical protein
MKKVEEHKPVLILRQIRVRGRKGLRRRRGRGGDFGSKEGFLLSYNIHDFRLLYGVEGKIDVSITIDKNH